MQLFCSVRASWTQRCPIRQHHRCHRGQVLRRHRLKASRGTSKQPRLCSAWPRAGYATTASKTRSTPPTSMRPPQRSVRAPCRRASSTRRGRPRSSHSRAPTRARRETSSQPSFGHEATARRSGARCWRVYSRRRSSKPKAPTTRARGRSHGTLHAARTGSGAAGPAGRQASDAACDAHPSRACCRRRKNRSATHDRPETRARRRAGPGSPRRWPGTRPRSRRRAP